MEHLIWIDTLLKFGTVKLGCLQAELGKGSFQELDQVAAVKQFTKYAEQAKTVKDIAGIIESAVKVRSRAAPLADLAELLLLRESLLARIRWMMN